MAGRAAIYTRISRDSSGDGEGVARQEELCRALAEAQGLEVAEVFSDNDLGASTRTHASKVRHAYAAMLDAARAGQFDAILAYSNSRLTRRMAELEGLISLVEETGVQISTVASGKYNLATSDGRVIARILASIDAGESERISERQIAAFRANAAQGKPKLMRQRAFGFEQDGITHIPHEAGLIREAMERFRQGATITSVVNDWNSKGIATATGGTWVTTTLKRAVLGWKSAGIITYHRQPMRDEAGHYVRGAWDPIISPEEREQALAMLSQKARKKVRHAKWMLSGLTLCGVCGAKMYGSLGAPGRGMDSYACKSSCVIMNARDLESFVQQALALHLQEVYLHGSRQIDSPLPEEQSWPGDEQIARLDSQISAIFKAWEEGILSQEMAFAQAARLDKERDSLRQQRENFLVDSIRPSPVSASIEEILAFIEGSVVQELGSYSDPAPGLVAARDEDYEKKTLVLRAELASVTVAKGVKGRRSTPQSVMDRLTFAWRDGTRERLNPRLAMGESPFVPVSD
ncbi:recombinase family protein [Pseudoclavibacter chungangensis]|uniref:Recombinase family protein n=1 Tax=Pseudoclavibacter chungangensis TaxID=587635 RepID=A0A7J5BM29_9MICO|nr:recombinase family protein [Pseudoclavibacter chungangensis]KAB1652104.1 recombinase family protein [Pseudoclavibacter chungangensis]NYJ65967.1 DNA invertase Pin-like site-specific DNA recombinase [Pseudoclavibacter chungangensis]